VTQEGSEGGGIFLTGRSRLIFPAGSITISAGPNGLSMSVSAVHVSREMCPVWLGLAVEHLLESERAHEEVLVALDADENETLAAALERESAAGMQAIVAAATALDALYASTKDKINLPPSLVSRWNQNGTARWRRVAEVLRRGFRVHRGRDAERLRHVAKEVYRFRDMAVHPSGSAAQVVFHPDLGKGTDWRFVSFSFASAQQGVWATLAFTRHLSSRPTEGLSEAMLGLRSDLNQMLQETSATWEAHYGSLGTNPSLDAPPAQPADWADAHRART